MGIHYSKAYKSPHRINDLDFWLAIGGLAIFVIVVLVVVYKHFIG